MGPICDVWDIFTKNFSKYYIQTVTLTVDKQLLGYCNNQEEHTNILAKPIKYGPIKYFRFVELTVMYFEC